MIGPLRGLLSEASLRTRCALLLLVYTASSAIRETSLDDVAGGMRSALVLAVRFGMLARLASDPLAADGLLHPSPHR